MKRIFGCAVVVLFLGAAPLLAQTFEGNEYDKGKTLYKNKCQFCHGIRGDGKGPAAEPLLGHPVGFINSKFWEDDVEKKIEDTIKKGKEMMPAFDLEPDEIKTIIWYMSHTFKKATQNNNLWRDENYREKTKKSILSSHSARVIATFAVKHCPGSTEFCAANRYAV